MNWNELSDFERRSCATKKRYAIEPSTTMAYRAYACNFCGGWHIASRYKKSAIRYNKDGAPIVPRSR